MGAVLAGQHGDQVDVVRAVPDGDPRRIGVNLNQAVAKLNATGQRSGDLHVARRHGSWFGDVPARSSPHSVVHAFSVSRLT